MDEPLQSTGRSRSARLPTPVKGQFSRHRLLRAAFMSHVSAPPRSRHRSQGCADSPGGSLPLPCSQGHAVQNGHLVLNAKRCWVGEARSRRCVTPIHGREVPQGLQMLMKVPDRIAQSSRRSQAPESQEGSSVPLPRVASLERPLLKKKSTHIFVQIQDPVRDSQGLSRSVFCNQAGCPGPKSDGSQGPA